MQSNIYDALKKGKHIKKGGTISVAKRTSLEPGNRVIITDDSKQELMRKKEKRRSMPELRCYLIKPTNADQISDSVKRILKCSFFRNSTPLTKCTR